MNLLLVADVYVPSNISAAVQLHDFAKEALRQGHSITVLVPSPELDGWSRFETVDHVKVLRVRTLRTKDVSYLRRIVAELVLPFLLVAAAFRQGALRSVDGLVWYSPSIFLGIAAAALRRSCGCRSYLILRDLFPDWAVDAGLLTKRSFAYRLLKLVERFQYRHADVIGVQSEANVDLVSNDAPHHAEIEVLHNWLSGDRASAEAVRPSALDAARGKVLFVYAGNMGVAQDLAPFIRAAHDLRERRDICFVFVGRGSEMRSLKNQAASLDNVLFVDEIPSSEIPGLFAACDVGIVALDPAHKTNNVPGKFLAYLCAGLPVLARINPGNTMHALINDRKVGVSLASPSGEDLRSAVELLASSSELRRSMSRAGTALAAEMFSPDTAVRQVVHGLQKAG